MGIRQVWAQAVSRSMLVTALILGFGASALAQAPSQAPVAVDGPADYVVGAQDVLVITSYDQPELTGKFTVETDGTFTYPFIGRMTVAGMTLRDVEMAFRAELVVQGFFKDPQITVGIGEYRSQKVYIVGEVRTPGAYNLSGDTRLVELLALSGSTLPTASGEVVVVRTPGAGVIGAALDTPPRGPAAADDGDEDGSAIRIDLRALEGGDLTQNVALRSGDTVFVLRAENVYVFGQVRTPGAYPLRDKHTTVLQALSLAGGTTERASSGRIRIVRIVDGEKVEMQAEFADFVMPRDTIVVPERFF